MEIDFWQFPWRSNQHYCWGYGDSSWREYKPQVVEPSIGQPHHAVLNFGSGSENEKIRKERKREKKKKRKEKKNKEKNQFSQKVVCMKTFDQKRKLMLLHKCVRLCSLDNSLFPKTKFATARSMRRYTIHEKVKPTLLLKRSSDSLEKISKKNSLKIDILEQQLDGIWKLVSE